MPTRRKKLELTIQEMIVTRIDSKTEVDTIRGGITLKMMVSRGLGLIHNSSEQTQEEDGSEMTQNMEEEADQGSLRQEGIARDQIVVRDEIVDQEVNSEIEVSPWTDRRAK